MKISPGQTGEIDAAENVSTKIPEWDQIDKLMPETPQVLCLIPRHMFRQRQSQAVRYLRSARKNRESPQVPNHSSGIGHPSWRILRGRTLI